MRHSSAVSEYQHRLELAVDRLKDLHNEEDGGWGASPHEPSSLVNTAEALSILRAAHEPYEGELVTRALEFVSRAVREHPKPRPTGRGEWTRYPIYALQGLTEYEGWRSAEVARKGVAAGLGCLKRFSVSGGWSAGATESTVSIFHTARAVRVLERLAIQDVQPTIAAARNTLMALRLTGSPAWPNKVGGTAPSAAKTALVSLALNGGDSDQREAADEAVAWLYKQRAMWSRSIHRDPDMSGVRWMHMTFALCLQACVAAGRPPAEFLDDLNYMNELWSDPESSWRDSLDSTSFRSGVIPSAAAVQTYQTIQRLLGGSDPVELPSRLGYQASVDTDYDLILHPSGKIAIRSAHRVSEEPFKIGRGRSIVDRLIAGTQPGSIASESRPAAEKAYGGKRDTLRRAIGRLNDIARRHSGVDQLVELESATVSLTTRRWEYADGASPPIIENDTTSQPHMSTNKDRREVTFFTFDLLFRHKNVAHGVFSRHGGVSRGNFDSLNTSTAVGDHPENVRENLARIAGAVGFEAQDVFRPRLVHGDGVFHLGSQLPLKSTDHPEADAVITDVPGILLMMSPADCAVLLLHDADHSAIGMVHAGWKGIVAELPRKTIEAMVERFDSRPDKLMVAVGPSVGPCHYRLAEPAQKTLPGWAPYLEDLEDGRTAIDLPGMLIDQLLDSGIHNANLQVDRRCTACNVDTFFSYWIDKPTTGRMAVALGLRRS